MENTQNAQGGQQMNKDQQIGFHMGALKTLASERAELSKILGIVENLMQMHAQSLKQLGVNLEATQTQQAQAAPTQPEQPIEDLLNKPQF